MWVDFKSDKIQNAQISVGFSMGRDEQESKIL